MPLTTPATLYRDWILGDATQKEYWSNQIACADGHMDDFPKQTLVEVVAEMLGDHLAQEIEGLETLVEDDQMPALFIRFLEETAGNIDYEILARGLIASLGAKPAAA